MNELRWDFADLTEQDEASTEEDVPQEVRRDPALQLVPVSESISSRDRDDPFMQQWIAERLSSGL